MRIALDFDGVIHWDPPGPFGPPPNGPEVPGALDWIRKTLAAGHEVVVFSCRASEAHGIEAMRSWFCRRGGDDLVDLVEWATTKPRATIYLDDRGYRFNGLWPSVAHLKGLSVWHR